MREGGGVDSVEEQSGSLEHSPAGQVSSGMQQGPLPPITLGFISICWWIILQHQHSVLPSSASCWLPEPAQTAPVPQLGEFRGGKSPLGAERQMGWMAFSSRCGGGKGRLAAAGRQELGKHQGHRSHSSPALSCWHPAVSVLMRLPVATWGFYTKSWCIYTKNSSGWDCLILCLGSNRNRTLSCSIDEYLYSHSQKSPAVALGD